MADVGNYCCFFCPSKDYSNKALSDACPNCERPYNFPLLYCPERINGYRIIRSLGRGFYGAAFVAEKLGLVKRKCVLKITPVRFYQFFEKGTFEKEVDLHNLLAQTASHIVGIIDGHSDKVITFSDVGKTELVCHIAVLEYVEGSLLKEYVSGNIQASADEICQIAIDLLRIRSDFEAHELNHNDLHAENIIVEELRPETRRPDSVCDRIKLKAIDLGSVSGESKSNENRLGDVGFIASHVEALLNVFLQKPSEVDDRDYRIALALQGITQGLQPQRQNLRMPDFENLIQTIIDAYNRASHPWRPWNEQLKLRGVGDHYNAQTLESWHVPQLLVDPDGRWVQEITKPGPQIVTGMRGCGKTMLLRALDLHARAARKDGETTDDVLSRLKKDNFVGLFVSAQRLLDIRPQSLPNLEHQLSKLFVNYALQAARALLHLKDLDPRMMAVGAHSKLAHAIANYLRGGEDLSAVVSLEDLERQLTNTLVRVGRELEAFRITAAPADAFSHLAAEFRSCANVIGSSMVFYLFDDVSTRYLELNKIGSLLSSLLFQNPTCAFKFTSEWQTIELGLKSPGREHDVREDRDITVFDLGADVLGTISAKGNKGKQFVSSILEQRAEQRVSHLRHKKPIDILGDVSLEQIAREISAANATAGQRKQVYRGLTCLTNVCVGDIGDIIKLYGEMLRRNSSGGPTRIPRDIQSECFRLLGSRRLYELNRRKSSFKDHALAFAEAAHELLVRSYKKSREKNANKLRLRQYSSIYVRVTTDDETKRIEQIDRLRELIDSSVFVFAGGAPRTKTKDSNPIQQFILTFRKIYGIVSFIGLADRDRFELSGEVLEKWLMNPTQAKGILLRNQIRVEVEDLEADELDPTDDCRNGNKKENTSGVAVKSVAPEVSKADVTSSVGYIGDLFDQLNMAADIQPVMDEQLRPNPLNLKVLEIDEESLASESVDVVLTGLGFEDRALASNQFLAKHLRPRIVQAVRYRLEGKSKEILNGWSTLNREVSVVDFETTRLSVPKWDGLAIIDVSGLTKPIIYRAVKRELERCGRVLVCHAAAERYYPLEDDLKQLFALERRDEPQQFLESLSHVLTGEKGPYSIMKLNEENSDPSRKRTLLTFGSAKHERLFSLLDQREFDHIEVLVSNSGSPRARVAGYAAEFVCDNYPNASMRKLSMHDLGELAKHLDERYLALFDQAGANVELGLTGSKTQAVASAILSAGRKVAQAWYVEPKVFDENRFSTGVGKIKVFDVRVEHAIQTYEDNALKS